MYVHSRLYNTTAILIPNVRVIYRNVDSWQLALVVVSQKFLYTNNITSLEASLMLRYRRDLGIKITLIRHCKYSIMRRKSLITRRTA